MPKESFAMSTYASTRIATSYLSRSFRLLQCLSLLIIAAFGLIPSAFAQSGGGGITGVVTDSSGAVIPKAQVTALNAATGVTTTRVASSNGNYTVNPLLPGTYTVTVTSPGFNAFRQENVVVDALANVGSAPAASRRP
jgi:hypothetical protein